MLKRILKYKYPIALGAIMILLLSLLILPTPILTKHILDKSIPQKNLKELINIMVLVVGILVVTRAISYAQGMLFYKINNKIVLDIKVDLLKKINRIPLKISKKYGKGYLISRIDNEVERLRTLFADTFVSIFKDILTFVVGFVAIFMIHQKLALISLIVLPFYAYFTIYFGKKIRKTSSIYYEKSAKTTQKLEESLSMFQLIKLFHRYNFNILRYYKSAKETYRSNIILGRLYQVNGLVVGMLTGLTPIIIIGYGGYEIISGRLTIGSLIAFNAFIGYVFGPTNRLVNINVQIQQALTALKRVQELFDLPEEESNKQFVFPGKKYQLEFKNVSFSYNSNQNTDKNLNEKPILNKINFMATQGERIGIVGSSGSGKTTLLRLLSGLFIADDGKILLNSKKLEPKDIVALRKYTAVVEQEPYIFNDTIYNNILFGNHNASREDILKAAKEARADIFIEKMDKGYQTEVKNQGGSLSVGQKQRLAIARALIKKPKILILDEATSNIDTVSEGFINETIFSLPEDMIVFIVAHRLSTIKDCDKIIVLDNGEIKEKGKHHDLIKENGVYFEMYEKMRM